MQISSSATKIWPVWSCRPNTVQIGQLAEIHLFVYFQECGPSSSWICYFPVWTTQAVLLLLLSTIEKICHTKHIHVCGPKLYMKVSTTALELENRSLIPISHQWHGQDKTVLSCLCRRCKQNWQQDKTVLSCLGSVSNFQVFSSLQYIWYWTVANWKWGRGKKLSCHVANSVHTTDTDKTRQDSFVLCVSAVWNRQNTLRVSTVVLSSYVHVPTETG